MDTNTLKRTPSSQDFAKLKFKALSTMTDIRNVERSLGSVRMMADSLGLVSDRAENESELDYLQRLANEAHHRDMSLRCENETAEFQRRIETGASSKPQTSLGRFLSGLANRIG